MLARSLYKLSNPIRKFSTDLIKPKVTCLFHNDTNTATYIASCPETGKCAIIDPVLDYDQVGHRVTTIHADSVIAEVTKNHLEPVYILETHVHADHLTGAKILKNAFPSAQTAIGFNVTAVQVQFSRLFNLSNFRTDGSQFDKLIKDGESFSIGKLNLKAFWSPGHTPACMVYTVGDAVFSGDTLFMPDFGTARCDFPGGSADVLYQSIKKLFELPDEYRVFVGHDYGTEKRGVAWESTMGEEKRNNKHLNLSTSRDAFVQWRKERDGTLKLPKLIMESLLVNLRNGELPEPEANGISYFKLPINAL
ncbi:unnamed protein product [Blepharisma stoltei]|uniref:Metallo-beta-lactamase domain-containing protein n=1 Tax=Blepharisma stoltei TaxID=1481888 RepID=A0AAU9IYL5_9CILI|nr:unnamed protein product [Blepharisma stoltei]